jgi:hypothetical protein
MVTKPMPQVPRIPEMLGFIFTPPSPVTKNMMKGIKRIHTVYPKSILFFFTVNIKFVRHPKPRNASR